MDSEKKITSITVDDEEVDYKSLTKFLDEDADRNKNSIANQFNELGEELLAEIDEKNKRKDLLKAKQIKYIVKHCDGKYLPRQLNSYSYNDVRNIYIEIRNNKKKFRKVIHFIFNL